MNLIGICGLTFPSGDEAGSFCTHSQILAIFLYLCSHLYTYNYVAISILKNFQTAANEVENYDWRDGDDDDGKLSRVLL